MFTRTLPLGTLPAGSRFRFPEDPPSAGYPYVVLPTPATYRGDRHFAPDESPVVIHRQDGRYPRYGQVAGFYPVQNDQGQLVAWVAHPATLVRAPMPFTHLATRLIATVTLLLVALATANALLSRLNAL